MKNSRRAKPSLNGHHKGPVLLSDDEAARLVLEVIRTRQPLDEATKKRLPEEWGEALLIATEEDAFAALDVWLRVMRSHLCKYPARFDAIKDALARARTQPGSSAAEPAKPPEPTDEETGIICLDDVEEKAVAWLWQDRIPLGKITILAGEGEIGKSYATLDTIARLTAGRPMPDGSNAEAEPCDCIFVTAEDGIADTIKPRLRMMEADMKRVFTLGLARSPNGKTSVFTIADIDRLEAVVKKRPGIKLIAIDPISAFLGRVDENKNAELRGLLGPLSEFADARGVAIVAITHFGKSVTTKAAAKILGSVAYTNAARVAWCVVADPNDPLRRLMLRVKNNLSPNRTGMAYTIRDGRVEWEETPVELSANEVLENVADQKRKGPPPLKSTKLAEWLWTVLQAGPERLSSLIDAARHEELLESPTPSKPSPSTTPLYNARKLIPSLHVGSSVEEFEIEERGRHRKYWRLVRPGG